MTTQPFIRCDHSTTEGFKTTPHFIKMVLNTCVKIYHHEYKGIKFFVCRNMFGRPRDWTATEIMSGSSLQMLPNSSFRTKKGCVSAAEDMIDYMGTERLNELIGFVHEKHPFDDVMTQDEYMERRMHNIMEAIE